MFTINTNGVIKMNKGDDAQFPLFLNIGTRMHPDRYVFKENDSCEVYFYLIPVNGDISNFIIKKTINTGYIETTTDDDSGEQTTTDYGCQVITEFADGTSETVNHASVINGYGDVVIPFYSTDTLGNATRKALCSGEYWYVVRAKVAQSNIISKNPNLMNTGNEFVTLQVTNKNFFYLLDDGIVRAM